MKFIFSLLVIVGFISTAKAQVGELPHYFNFDGYLLDASSNPITGSVSVTFQIYNPAANCLVFEENHASITPGADGSFSVKVGTGTRASGSVDGGLAWKAIFQNNSQLRAVASTNCTAGYTPSVQDARKLRVIVGATTLTPDYIISSVPTAIVAETLQGKTPSDFVSSVPYILPNTQGSNGQVMTTDGAGNASWATPAGGGITSMNGLTNAVQTFAIGTSSLAPLWTSAAGVHTLDIPMASTAGVGAGLISKSDYDSFTSKMPAPAGATNETLRYNGSNWVSTSGLSVDASNNVTLANAPTLNGHAATKQYVDASLGSITVTSTEIQNGTITDADVGDVGVDKISGGIGKYFTYAPNNTACTNNQILIWDNANGRWVCSSANFVGLAGGTMTGGLVFGNYASASTPSIAFVNAGNGLFAPVANEIALGTSGVERVRFTSSGNVGIGTTTPSAMLEVNGPIKASNVVVITGSTPGTGCATAGMIGYHSGTQTHVFCDGTTWKSAGGPIMPGSGSGGFADFTYEPTVVMSSPSPAISISGMQDGGTYKLVLQSATSQTYTFSGGGCSTWKYRPANGNTAASLDTIYKIQRINTICYVDWATGY